GVRQAVARRRGAEGYFVLGDGLEEARLLARAAGPGRTLLGGGTPGRLPAAGYSFRELPPLKRRGRRVRVFELLGARADARTLPSPPATSFHGRARELGGLREAWRAAVDGDVQVACALVGEAGIGKSRLVAELATWAQAEHGEVLAVAAPARRRAPPPRVVGRPGPPSVRAPAARGPAPPRAG